MSIYGVSNHRRLDYFLPFVWTNIKENTKARVTSPLLGESIGDRWVPLTKGQWRGKFFHFMTLSRKKLKQIRVHMYVMYCIIMLNP